MPTGLQNSYILEGLRTGAFFGEAEYFEYDDLSILYNVYFNTNIGCAIRYLWTVSAISPFPMRGRHKGFIRLDGLRGKNLVPLDDDRSVSVEHPWCHSLCIYYSQLP